MLLLGAVSRNACLFKGGNIVSGGVGGRCGTRISYVLSRGIFSEEIKRGRLAAYFSTESFLVGDSCPYIERMFESWKKDSKSVHSSWDAYFTNVSKGVPPGQAFVLPPRIPQQSGLSSSIPFSVGGISNSGDGTMTCVSLPQAFYIPEAAGSLPAGASYITPEIMLSPTGQQSVHDTSRVIQMVRGYQMRGHEMAKIEPLGLPPGPPFASVARKNLPANIDYKYYGFTEADLLKVFDCRVPGLSGFLGPEREPRPLKYIVQRLEETYCGNIGFEYMHISDQQVCNFIRQKVETPQQYTFSHEMKKKILVRTARAQLFEQFFAYKFSTSKRFGLDGCETIIVAMKAVTKRAAKEGVNSIVMGMPHRGRLNVLVNVMHKPMQQMMSEFQGVTGFGNSEWGNTGDVKYHLGVEFDHWDTESARYIHMGVLANPSHLEAVDPLVIGQTRAQQYYSGDTEKSKVIPIILHGDASFAGQGVVYETLQMSKLPSYDVGGTIHIVVNNQIGFTTNPVDGGSGKYCTDIAKAIDAPVFHVNADDPEAVTFVAELAFEYRQRFKSDVIIDLVGYRRYGHNELDMPKFTQPQMYTLVASHKPVLDLYSSKLIKEGVITQEEFDKVKVGITSYYSKEYEKSKKFIPSKSNEYLPQWKHMVSPDTPCPPRLTGLEFCYLKELGKKISTIPQNFNPHPTIAKTFKARLDAINTEDNVDFGLAEALAFASLLSDGFGVRLSGQDCQRGTFSHRHAVIHDQTLYSKYNIFDSLQSPHTIEINNSLLSEYAALGYEVGYALEHPDTLCLWEAQFGDFANGAQVVIDQFIASGEAKWNKQCGIVMILPHGYDGQGPEHSSARMERYLQLCDDREDVIHPENWDIERTSVIQRHNIQVVYCSTPSNYFHVLRRQVHRGFRKPLIIMLSKRILKMRAAFCSLKEFDENTRFQRYIPDKDDTNSDFCNNVKRLIVCSGQVYYDLLSYRENAGIKNVAISRVEQLSPFPFDAFIDDVKNYSKLEDIVWAQEEPMNAGPWFYTSKRIESSLRHMNYPNNISSLIYAGRDTNAAPAVGDHRTHQQELETLLEDAFNLNKKTHSYLEKYLENGNSLSN